MEPLNLKQRPPRKPTDVVGGVMFMARTIDKIRATLPGGDLGAYTIPGQSTRMLETLGIADDDLRSVVALAQNDDDVAAWVVKHTTPDARNQWNTWISSQTIRDRMNVDGWFDRYPFARELPVDTPLVDVLAYDDMSMFASE